MGDHVSEKLLSESKLSRSEFQTKRIKSGWLRGLQLFFLGIGLILLIAYAGIRLRSQVSARLAVEQFKAAQVANKGEAQDSSSLQAHGDVDFSLWSDKRIQAYRQGLLARTDPPLGILRIPKLHLEVPVYAGTEDQTLDLGVGWILGTARPGQAGNVGIAGHRDGFFRGLKDVGPGDRLELSIPDRTDSYVVDRVLITDPNDVSVLNPRTVTSLTLVTCYPFYFVGSAPQRYIVQASVTNGQLNQNAGDQLQSQPPISKQRRD
jgi:sortase A